MHAAGRTGLTSAAIATALVLGATACGASDDEGAVASHGDPTAVSSEVCAVLDSTEPVTITFGIPSDVVEYMPWQLGVAEGLFEEAGITLDIQPNIKPPTLVAAVVSDSIDVNAASGGLMAAALEGAPARRFMDTQQRSLQALYVSPEIKEIADLKGEKIAITSLGGAISESVLRVLEEEGLNTASDVEMIATGTLANSLAALQAGQVAAAVVSSPLDLMARKAGFQKLFAVSDYIQDSPVGLGTSVQQLEKEREKFLRLVDATYDAIAYVRENKDVAVDWLASHYSLSREDAEVVYDTVVPTYVEEARAPVEAAIQQLVSSERPTPTEEDLAKTVDYSLSEAVLACREAA